MEWKNLQAAAFYDNDTFIKEYLECYQESEEQDKNTLTKVLHKAVESCSIKVVQAILSSPHVTDVMGVDDEKGWNGLHFAASAVVKESMTPATNYRKLLKIIYLLFKSGIDPTVKDAMEKTPQDLAVISGFTLGAALLELLRVMWNHNTVDHSETRIVTYADIWIHKELLRWAVEYDFDEVVSQILKVHHPKANSNNRLDFNTAENRRKFLLSLKSGEEWSIFHLATERYCVKAFKSLLTHSGISLSSVVNQCPSDTKHSLGSKITPLSSILVKQEDSKNPLMDALIECDRTCRQHNDHPITNVDLSYTYTGEKFCLRIFEFESMRTLKVCNAQLVELPFCKLSQYPQLLTHLDISNNQLKSLPKELFTCFNLDVLNVSYNPLKHLPSLWWKSRSLRRFWASSMQLEEVFTEAFSSENLSRSFVESQGYARPEVYHRPIREVSHMAVFEDEAVSKLRVLDLSNNNISEFPHCFACIFPRLENLNLSKNRLTTVCYIQELPATLGRLDLRENHLSSMDLVSSIPQKCFISENTVTCNHMVHSELPRLQDLLLSHNPNLRKLSFTYSSSSGLTLSCGENDKNNTAPVHVCFPNLTRLEVSHCSLRDISCGLDLMSKLRVLDISYNPIHSIPLGICHLKDLEDFKYEGTEDQIIYQLDQCRSVAAKRYYMKFYEDEAISDPSVRLMLVGLASRGKSTLLNHLRWVDRMNRIPVGWRERMCQDNSELDMYTIGVDQDVWYYSVSHDEPYRGESVEKMITFYTWDFAGQEEYYATHQCYLSRKALYVLCWRATDGINGVMELKEWLLSIQAKAKDAPVVIVGTHVDLIPIKERLQTCNRLKNEVKQSYCRGLPYYPTIKGIMFVSCPSTLNRKDIEVIKDLRRHLYNIASSMQVTVDPRYPKMRLIEQKVPKKYRILHEFIIAQAAVLRRHKETPILKLEDLKRSLQLKPVKELKSMDNMELYYGLEYLKDNGLLLHFDSMLLSDYYFIDPQWLCDVLAVIVSPLKQINDFGCGNFSVVQKGNVTTQQFYGVLTQYHLKHDHIDVILKLLYKFEVIVKLDADNILIPLLLEDNTGEQDGLTQTFFFPPNRRRSTVSDITKKKKICLRSNKSCYRRIFMAPHVPVSFWPRFIARCLSCNYFCQILVNCGEGITVEKCLTPNKIVVDGDFFQWHFDKRNIRLLFGDHTLLSVNSIGDRFNKTVINFFDSLEETRVECHYKEGFVVTIPSHTAVMMKDGNEMRRNETFSPQILSHVLDLIDQVMRDHFEGLIDQGIYNDNFLLQLIPCPFCYGDKYRNTMETTDADYEDVNEDTRYKDILFCFSVQFCLQKQQGFEDVVCFKIHNVNNLLEIRYIAPDLAFDDFASNLKIDDKLLDRKGMKYIHRGGYGTVNRMKLNGVANAGIVAVKTIHDSLESLASTYGLIRIELNKLSSANHPNILQFIGLTVVPPAIVLEYAPLGSLHDVSNQYKEKNCPICPSSLAMILHQMGKALDYLHQDRYIVHCDIKPSNILVFAFPEAGHSCISQYFDVLGCRLCQTREESTGVLVKLADLGTACFIGPEGFSKRPSTPGHNAPEDILYFGRELLTEKVDVFSLGTTLFELMTHRVLPGIVHENDFSDEIKLGRRPRFLPKDPKYPSVFTQCLFSCWNQDYRRRPSASKIVDVFRSPQNISFLHSYPISKGAQHTFVVVSTKGSQFIWMVSEDRCTITVGRFVESQYSPVFDLTFVKIIPFIDNKVKFLQQVGEMVWVVVEDGRIAVFDTDYQNQEYIEINDFPGNAMDLIKICPINECTVALGYSSGVVTFVEHPKMRCDSFLLLSVDLKLKKRVINTIQCQSALHDIELMPDIQELWCGCNTGLIEVVNLSSKTLNCRLQSPDVFKNSPVLQVKFASMRVFTLHRNDLIGCWAVREHAFLKVISPSFQASSIFPLHNYLFISTMCGRILQYSLSEEQLIEMPGSHKHGTRVLKLAALNGKVTHNWLISGIGSGVHSEDDAGAALDNESVGCQVLLSLGSGHHEMFESGSEIEHHHILTWCLKC